MAKSLFGRATGTSATIRCDQGRVAVCHRTEVEGSEPLIGAVADNQGSNAENRIHRRQRDDAVPGDHSNPRVNDVEIIADAAEKQEDRNVQEHVDAVHKPPHIGSIKALKQISSDPPALVRGCTGIGVLHEFAAPLLDKGAC